MKREGKDKKYGFGGKKREKGQSDPRSLNDLGSFNPKQGGSGRSRQASHVRWTCKKMKLIRSGLPF